MTYLYMTKKDKIIQICTMPAFGGNADYTGVLAELYGLSEYGNVYALREGGWKEIIRSPNI